MNGSFDKTILDPEFSLDGAHLIEASAGTGKTYNIQNVYARLIMEKGLHVAEIQVMTYTDAATKELHDRLHAVLKDLQCRFTGTDCPGRDEADTRNRNQRAEALINCTPAERRPDARNGIELALLEFDNAAISTIHGFCQHILNRYAFETGINLSPVLEDNKSNELNSLAENWWRKRPADTPSQISLNTLKTYVQRLSLKSDFHMEQTLPEIATPEAFLLQTAKTIVDAYEADTLNRETMNFDDLLRALRDALRPERPFSGELIAKLRQEYKAALIDEFQDTDPVQYEIFERIFLNGNPGPLFFVGDPKQAIYSFRGGDIYTYLKAKGTPGLSKASLNVNHRSTSQLVAAVNAMFMDEAASRTFGDERIGYDAPVIVEEDPRLSRPQEETPLKFFFVHSGNSAPERWAAVQDFTVEKILELLREETPGKRYEPKDIAILTGSNDRNAELQALLRKRNVPSVIHNAGNVFASSVAEELRIFLLSVSIPSDPRLLLAALSTVFGGCPFEQLPRPDDVAALEEHLKRFADWNKLWRTRGLNALAAELDASGFRGRLARQEDGERLLADMEQIWELAFSAIRKIGPSMEAFLAWLTERINAATGKSEDNDETNAEEYLRELESDEDAVRIMTIHKSKGLQFPVVFLPDCWNVAPKVFSPMEYHDETGQLFFSVDKSAKAKALQECIQEKTRLLYVAMTRAIENTCVIAPPLEQWKKEEPLLRLLQNLKARNSARPVYEERTVEPDATPGKYVHPEPELEVVPIADAPDYGKWISAFKGSYSSLFPSMHGENSEDDGRDVDPWSGSFEREEMQGEDAIFRVPEGAATGTCWHNILERLPFNAGEPEITRIAERELAGSGLLKFAEPAVRTASSGGPVAEKPQYTPQTGEYLRDTVRMLNGVLKFPLVSPSGERFALNQIPWEKRLSEQEFNFSTGSAAETTRAIRSVLEKHWSGDPEKAEFLQAMARWERPVPRGYMTGFIDLIFQHGDFYYVVDWKSNSLEKTADSFHTARVRREMAEHGYFFQYLLYAVVLHKYLKQTLKDQYSWEKNFGGIRYYFLRGIVSGGSAPVFSDRPSEALLDELGQTLGLERES